MATLAGCSSEPHVYDQAAHRQALEEHGVEVAGSMEPVTEAMESACESEDPDAWVIGFLDEGGDPEMVRIGVEHMCPDRAEEFDEALAG